jgi:murein DD-endopeptidase MepM/ murein hydrolase activator NlpD
MARKFYTCIIVPDTSSNLHKLRVPIKALYAAAAVGIISFLILAGLGFNYAHMAIKVADYEKLQAENTELKIETKNLEVSARKLDTNITALEALSTQLTRIVQGDAFARRLASISPAMAVAAARTAGGATTDVTTAELLKDEGLKTDVESMRERTTELEGQLRLLEELATHQDAVIRYTPTIWPIQGRIASSFGRRRDPFTGEPETHLGLDIVALLGTPVKAPADGIVLYSQRRAQYGNLIILDHGNGLTTRHGHLSRFAIKAGQRVSKGQVIGYVGMTGRTTGPHLHYEVRLNDRPVNPRSYLPPRG